MLGWLNKSPKDIHIRIPQTCVLVTLHGKKDFVIELRTLEMERRSWIIQAGPQCNHKCPCRGRQEGQGRERGKGDVMTEQRGLKMLHVSL